MAFGSTNYSSATKIRKQREPMSDVSKINDELRQYSQRLAVAVSEFDVACKDFANKRSDYEIARAKAFLRSDAKTAAAREAETILACEIEARESRIAEGLCSALKERIRSIQSVINAAQTRASFLKSEMKLAGRDY